MTGNIDLGQNNNPGYFNTHTPLDAKADVRDLVSALVAGGKVGISGDDRAAVYSRLQVLLGKDQATKLVNHINIFNQRSDVGGKNGDQLLTQFYDMGSNDPSVNKIITDSRNLGHGVIGAANDSHDTINQKVQGNYALNALPVTAGNVQKVADVSGSNGF